MKNRYLVLFAALLVIGSMLFVACNKNDTPADTTADTTAADTTATTEADDTTEAEETTVADETTAADETTVTETETEVETEAVPEIPFILFWSSIDHINGMGPNGSANFAGRGGNYNIGFDTIDAIEQGVAINENGTLSIGGWLGVDGGTARFVFSVDGGLTWLDATGGYDGEPLPGHYAGLGFTDATLLGMFNNAQSPVVADLTAYAGQTLTVYFAAVSAADNEVIVPFVAISNYTVPGGDVETETEAETEAETEVETETTTNETVINVSGVTVSSSFEPFNQLYTNAQNTTVGAIRDMDGNRIVADDHTAIPLVYRGSVSLGSFNLAEYSSISITYAHSHLAQQATVVGGRGLYLTSQTVIGANDALSEQHGVIAQTTYQDNSATGLWVAKTATIDLSEVTYDGDIYLTFEFPTDAEAQNLFFGVTSIVLYK